MTIINDLLPVAVELLNDEGIDAVFSVPASESYDPATGATTFGTAALHTVKIVPPVPYSNFYVDGDLIRGADTITFIAGSGLKFTLAKAMEVTIGSDVWTIIGIKKIPGGATVVVWELQLRR